MSWYLNHENELINLSRYYVICLEDRGEDFAKRYCICGVEKNAEERYIFAHRDESVTQDEYQRIARILGAT